MADRTGTRDARLQQIESAIRRVRPQLVQLRNTSDYLSWVRLGVFVGGLLLSLAAFYLSGAWLFWLILLLSLLLFILAAARHRLVEARIARRELWLERQETQLARMRLEWERLPPTTDFPRPDHPYEDDLDLVGTYSVHRLLDTAVTRGGSQRLRAWLTAPVPDPVEIARRQGVVRELAGMATFRTQLILAARLAGTARSDAAALERWLGRQPRTHPTAGKLLLLTGLIAATWLLFLLDVLGILPPLWIGSGLLYAGLIIYWMGDAEHLFDDVLEMRGALRQLAAVAERIEARSFEKQPQLRALCAPFLQPDERPSESLRQLGRITTAVGVRQNPALWFILHAFLPWDQVIAYWLMQYKLGLTERAPRWLACWYDLEALGSMANALYLNPGHTLPTVFEPSDDGTLFRTEGIGHPLIPVERRVTNDFSLGRTGEIAIITGSNMAGKSSFLKTVGVNLALAFAGGPVVASRFDSALFRLFSCIAVSDSVTDGISYFYAEVRCLKGLLKALDAPHPYPLFFLIDEIFRGTNNRERLIGSRAYLRALTHKNGLGLVSTHDLELVTLADEYPSIQNYHFRDNVVDSRMDFDYTLRSGPCPTTNALTIMRLEGLPVPSPEEVTPA